MSLSSAIKKFGVTEYSDDKKTFNAIVTSDATYVPKKEKNYRKFKFSMRLYAIIVFTVTAVSLAMLAFDRDTQQKYTTIFSIIEAIVFVVLTIDLFLRWYTSEVRMKKGNWSYFLFPFTFTGMMLIASLLPSLYLINLWTGEHVQVFKTFESMKFLRIFRIILLANLVPGLGLFRRVLGKEKSTLYTVFGLVLVAIVLFALVIFNVEQGKTVSDAGVISSNQDTAHIKTFFDALYFSTVTLTTIGFGDISPVTSTGRVVVMVMSVLGVAILAIPSGVIAGGFITELKLARKAKEEAKANGTYKKHTPFHHKAKAKVATTAKKAVTRKTTRKTTKKPTKKK